VEINYKGASMFIVHYFNGKYETVVPFDKEEVAKRLEKDPSVKDFFWIDE
jgi:hypothetical protein